MFPIFQGLKDLSYSHMQSFFIRTYLLYSTTRKSKICAEHRHSRVNFPKRTCHSSKFNSHLSRLMNLDLYFHPLPFSWAPVSSSWLQDVSTWVFHCQRQLKAQKGKLTIFLFKLTSLLNFQSVSSKLSQLSLLSFIAHCPCPRSMKLLQLILNFLFPSPLIFNQQINKIKIYLSPLSCKMVGENFSNLGCECQDHLI